MRQTSFTENIFHEDARMAVKNEHQSQAVCEIKFFRRWKFDSSTEFGSIQFFGWPGGIFFG